MDITSEVMKMAFPAARESELEPYITPLNEILPKWKITTPKRIAAFLAQVAHESGNFHYKEENLNYSAQALLSVFGRYFSTKLAAQYARQPEKIANRVYANRMGNGDEASGDGWRYHGRGLIQLTGKDNHIRCGRALGVDLVAQPELLMQPEYSVQAACWFWSVNGLNEIADRQDFELITRRINGGLNGIEDRRKHYASTCKVFGV